jgi:peptidoglycan hydrolase-like protein with peptidoglycan-binding domain
VDLTVARSNVQPHDLTAWLTKQVGRTESPANSNHVFVWKDLIKAGLAAPYFDGQPWCAGLQEDAELKTKAPRLHIASPYYCPSRVQFARSHTVHGEPLWLPAHRWQEAREGDQPYFAFSTSAQASGLAEHVERLRRDANSARRILPDIGGNTSSGPGGSQDNGGGVFDRDRPVDESLLGFLRYSLVLAHPTHLSKQRVKRNPFGKALRAASLPVTFGAAGDAVRAIQWAAGCPVDGVWGIQTEHAVRHFQRYHTDPHGRQLVTDGEVGKFTRAALLKITHHYH